MTDPQLHADALEEATDIVWMRTHGEVGVCCHDREQGNYKDAEGVAREAIAAYLDAASDAPAITTSEEHNALPIGSMIKCHWPDGSHPDQIVIRCNPNSGASSGGFSLMSGMQWSSIINWGAMITLLHRGC